MIYVLNAHASVTLPIVLHVQSPVPGVTVFSSHVYFFYLLMTRHCHHSESDKPRGSRYLIYRYTNMKNVTHNIHVHVYFSIILMKLDTYENVWT